MSSCRKGCPATLSVKSAQASSEDHSRCLRDTSSAQSCSSLKLASGILQAGLDSWVAGCHSVPVVEVAPGHKSTHQPDAVAKQWANKWVWGPQAVLAICLMALMFCFLMEPTF